MLLMFLRGSVTVQSLLLRKGFVVMGIWISLCHINLDLKGPIDHV